MSAEEDKRRDKAVASYGGEVLQAAHHRLRGSGRTSSSSGALLKLAPELQEPRSVSANSYQPSSRGAIGFRSRVRYQTSKMRSRWSETSGSAGAEKFLTASLFDTSM